MASACLSAREGGGFGHGARAVESVHAVSRARADEFEAEALPHTRRLYATAYRSARNAHDAEDLVQETLLRAYRAFDSFQPGTNMRAWLFTIFYRVRADGFRRAGRSPKTVELLQDLRSEPPPQAALATGHEHVARALHQIPERYRTALLLRDVQDFSYDEIARIIKTPIGTVMSRIHRGRSALRQALVALAADARAAD